MMQNPKALTRLEAQAKADECRALIPAAADNSQRIMLTHIAETWERLGARIEQH